MFWKQKETNVLVAVEIGTSKVVAAVAELKADGSMTLLGVGEVPASGVRKGEIVEFQDAQTCVKQALHLAEQKADVEIHEAYLLLTGAHIVSRTDSVRCTMGDEETEVSEETLAELNELAQNVSIPRDYVFIHSLLQHYKLDHGVVSREPLGLLTRSVEGYYHLIYGLDTRLRNTVRCVQEHGIKVSGYALSSFAVANELLTKRAKEAGSVAVDMGAGTTDYIVYQNGAVVHTGVLGLGGDHLTQDLSFGLRIPYQKAEALKKSHGDLYMNGEHADERIRIEPDVSTEELMVYRESMVAILEARQREIFELIHEDLEKRGIWPALSGKVYLTGGASLLRGVERMASEIFPVECKLAHEHNLDGDQTYKNRPDLSAVLGLLRIAQKKEMQKRVPKGWRRLQHTFTSLLETMRLL